MAFLVSVVEELRLFLSEFALSFFHFWSLGFVHHLVMFYGFIVMIGLPLLPNIDRFATAAETTCAENGNKNP